MEDSGRGLIKVLLLPGVTDENHKRTELLQTEIIQRYR
jgi:hypothetical protein